MNTPHKWAEVIHAKADGAVIQVKEINAKGEVVWVDINGWYFDSLYLEFQVKPKSHRWQLEIDAFNAGVKVEYRYVNGGDVGDWVAVKESYAFDVTRNFEFRIPIKWQKEIDAQKAGKQVQARTPGTAEWIDGIMQWHFREYSKLEYRVKPENMRYRVARFNHGGKNQTRTTDTTTGADWLEQCVGFIEWLGDWQEVEVLS